jgi:hypothetical protein
MYPSFFEDGYKVALYSDCLCSYPDYFITDLFEADREPGLAGAAEPDLLHQGSAVQTSGFRKD